jgi:hypothetical protein
MLFYSFSGGVDLNCTALPDRHFPFPLHLLRLPPCIHHVLDGTSAVIAAAGQTTRRGWAAYTVYMYMPTDRHRLTGAVRRGGGAPPLQDHETKGQGLPRANTNTRQFGFEFEFEFGLYTARHLYLQHI